jgi:uncharacterized short protein YbdD (DUF466 family)
MIIKLKTLWQLIRQLSGDDAYERYLLHHASYHPEQIVLNKAEFFKRQQENKWNGVKRCC